MEDHHSAEEAVVVDVAVEAIEVHHLLSTAFSRTSQSPDSTWDLSVCLPFSFYCLSSELVSHLFFSCSLSTAVFPNVTA